MPRRLTPAAADAAQLPLRTPNLVGEVATILRRRILAGELPAGGELPPTEQLAETFGVSRTVIREALRHLQAQDLVEVERGRRPRVKPVDAQAAIDTLNAMLRRTDGSLEDLIEVRQALEVRVADLAAQRATDAQLQAMVDANDAMLAARKVEDRLRNDWLFHERLAEASNNQLFIILVKTISGLFQELLRATSGSDVKFAHQAHARLIEAVRQHDSAQAQQVALQNLRWTRQDLEQSRQAHHADGA